MTPLLRLLAGAWLAWCVASAVLAPELPALCAAAAAIIVATTLSQPRWGLALVAALAPAGALLAAAPIRAVELFAWAFLAAWLLRVWRPLSVTPWPRTVTIPAGLYGGALMASWCSLTIAGAAGVPPFALPQFLLHAIPLDHLIFSSPEAETWTLLHSLTGISILMASLGIARDDPRTVRTLAWALTGAMAILAVATLVDIGRQWAVAGYGAWFLLRYVHGERFSLHMTDLNAAGSLYVLAGLIAATYVLLQPGQRRRWTPLLLVLLPALWLTGSRSSYVAMIAGLTVLAVVQRRWQPTWAHMMAAAALLAVMMVAATVMVDPESDAPGSARRSVNLRSQFSETTARMFVSSPMFGVGIGRYFDRSAEFMTPELRGIYANENAHNYFAQQFAELGVVGGLLFAWVVAAVVSSGWKRLRQSTGEPAFMGLFVGTAGYLLTCLTSHPLLVQEAALPFWAAFGIVGSASRHDSHASTIHRAVGAVTCAVLFAGVALAAVTYVRRDAIPPEQGFHGLELTPDGTRFRWMTRHAVTYIPEGPGFLRLRLHAPDRPTPRPLVVETAIAGRIVDRREMPAGQWVIYDIPARGTAPTPFRRVDFRVNQVWTEEVSLGRRQARRPISVMAGEIDWIPLR